MNTNPWENYPHVWKTESAFMSWVRGGIRKGLWNTNPIKLEFIKNNRKLIENPNPKGKKSQVFGATCSLCHKNKVLKDIQVDHIEGGHSLRSIDDIDSFIKKIVLVSDSDLALVCTDCHKIKSYADAQGISFGAACVEKNIIAISKLSKNDQIEFLEAHGIFDYGKTKVSLKQAVVALLRLRNS